MGALENSSVVVTGASRGLGEAMAVGYAREGAALVLAARTTDDLERVAGACKEAGARAVTVVTTDVTDEDQVAALVQRALESNGSIDVFVANAATSYGMLTDKRFKELWSYDLDVVKQIFDVNITGLWLCMKHALPAIAEGGSFISVGSETGRALYPGAGIYAISKSTVDALSTLAAREAAERKVRVNVLSPGGMVDTQLFGPTGMPEWLKQAHPPLPADVIVPAAVWLASAESADVTGTFVSAKEFNASGAAAAHPLAPARG
jgi:NAD(P)-dependent dehydrogenase (short-subunit alcohol dehydrogenase family)